MTKLCGAGVMVTGATGGLGQALARRLHVEGARLTLTGRRTEQLEALAAEVGAVCVTADLADRADVERLAALAESLDVVVANAAVPASGDLEDFDQAQIDRAFGVNLLAPIAMTRAVLPAWRRRGSGHLVYMSSLAGKVAPPGSALYSSTKFALRGFAASLRVDLRGSGIGVSTVFPGFVRGAGMFADSGATLPPGIWTVTPEAVAAALVAAVTADRGEVDVAPALLRLGVLLGGMAPGIASAVQARFGTGTAARIAVGQRHKR